MLLNIVNGYVCHNCTDVENAKKGVDPAHPKKDFPGQSQTKTGNASNNPAVIFSGAFAKDAVPKTDPALPADAASQSSANAAKTGITLNVAL
jgi:hypothetical protein